MDTHHSVTAEKKWMDSGIHVEMLTIGTYRYNKDFNRFWNSGYWRNHLGRRPYHISALYVIDLQRFRLISAGDRLRGQYQMLSQDPNRYINERGGAGRRRSD